MNGMDRTTGKPLAGADHLRQSIADILSTPLGTRLCRRDYGSELPELFDQPMNELGRIRVFAATAGAIMQQERRARISRISLAAGDTAGAFVTRLHVQRIVGYPDLVQTGRMTAAAAADGIRIIGTIACTWWTIAEGQPEAEWTQDPDLGGAWPYERIAALTIAARRPRAAAIELPNDYEIVGFADAIDTLIWWETAWPSARLIADCNITRQSAPRSPAAHAALPVPIAPNTPASPRAGQPFLFGVAA